MTPKTQHPKPTTQYLLFHEKYGVNHVGMICAIDRTVFPALMEYWVPEVDLIGIHELVGNALVFPGGKKRTTDLRGRPLKGVKPEETGEE